MHEVVRLCIKKNQRTGNAQLTKAPQMHEALRLCMTNGRGLDNGRIGLAAQNARSTAPAQQKHFEA
jgi:hypothetical protein